MPTDILPLPARKVMVPHVCKALSRYWPNNSHELTAVPVMAVERRPIIGPLKLQVIQLPDWAKEWGVEGVILVPSEACRPWGEWKQVDWWLAAFLLQECWHERIWELQHESVHSYSSKLQGWDARAWEHAWVNRIGLFLRAWAAHAQGKAPDELFGELPQTEILMTHDVDAISKTLPIRLKQGAFNLFNAGRLLLGGEVSGAAEKLGTATRFLFGNEDWWTFDKLLEMEKRAGVNAQFNFYADDRKKNIKSWLFDPSYDASAQRAKQLFRQIKDQHGIIGLHPTFDSWDSAEIIRHQKKHLSVAANQKVTACRQHWLRFSWKDTWSAQENAGIEMDTTLMFNDRPGFRASIATSWTPWSQQNDQAQKLLALPTVIMDSHFFDYQHMDDVERKTSMRSWLNEVQFVHGQIAVLWHPHTLTQDYGWTAGFHELLNTIREFKKCPHLQ